MALANPETDQIIIKYKKNAGITSAMASERGRMEALSHAAGVALKYFREMSGDAHVLKLPSRMPDDVVRKITEKLSKHPDVEYAEPDLIMTHGVVPNDTRYVDQWGLNGAFGIRADSAWDITTGNNTMVVAVIDTGILPNHPDITGRTVTGYDFITNTWTANDGDGRDADPTDPGDWVVANVCKQGAAASNSSWHGTHVAGTIAASSNNSTGVAGVNWQTRILPARVLGRCGGSTSDIADAIRWSSGLTVSGVPINANPARVINMSLWAPSATCGTTYQNAINDARSSNTTVVVIAGNANLNVSGYAPANCTGVVVVAANDNLGQMASFSNFGAIVDVTAPGVDILSTWNSGTTTAGTDTYANMSGTSMAAPHVSGVASLALSMRSWLSPDQVEEVLRTSVSAFPTGSSCTTAICGTGIIDADAAVRDIFVNWNSPGMWAGLKSTPYPTIKMGYDWAWTGARLRVSPGTYNEPMLLNKTLSIEADGGDVLIR